jgi:hypothetical protein
MNDYLFTYNIIAKTCDYVFPTYGHRYEQFWKHHLKPLTDFSKVEPYSIIYADLSFLGMFSFFCLIKVPFTLVSTDSDFTVPYENHNKNNDAGKTLLKHPFLLKWFTINIDSKHPKLIYFPIGLSYNIQTVIEDTRQTVIDPTLKHEEFMEALLGENMIYIQEFLNSCNINPIINIIRKDKKLLTYKCTLYNTDTDQTYYKTNPLRRDVLKVLTKNCIEFNNKLVPWKIFINEVINSKFCLCLPGKGIDTFRTWETLSVGTIPIVMRTSITPLYENLPILIIDNIDELTIDFLEKSFDRITKDINLYEWKKITSSYWINKIKNIG